MNKANRLVGLIRRSYKHIDGDSLVQLYKALVRPHLEYGHVIWSFCFKTDLNKVKNVQRRLTKLIPKIRDLEYPEGLRILKLPSIAYRRNQGDIIEVYKLLTGKYSTNEGLLKINKNSSTRGHHLKLEKQRFRLQIRRHSFPIKVVNLWSSLPKHVVLVPTLNTFKNRLDRYWGRFQYNLEKPPRTHTEDTVDEPIAQDIEELADEIGQQVADLQRP